ncbi:hypothetical protein AB0L75_40495 [Streptomyces sp. NPDC052101]|uniref:hypothetical protein n=1 Tax=Streptomyces sp. NPDC052101 TaxID=3155763 RepID=UPI003424E6F3
MRFATAFTVGTLSAGLLAGPANAAPSALMQDSCTVAQQAAEKAGADYHAAARDYLAQINAGGHPGTAERDHLAQLKAEANKLAAQAARACPGT